MKTVRYIILLWIINSLNAAFSQNQDFDENAIVSGNQRIYESSPFVAGVWSSLANTPHDVSRSCCAYVIVGGVPYVYQFGGGNNSSDARRVARLNLTNNQWQNSYSQMPHQMSSATAIPMNGDSTIFVLGGNNNTLGKTLKYNVYANSWQTVADMQTEITDALVVKYNSSTIFVVGGGDGYFGPGSIKTNVVQSYNINSNTYTYRTNYPIPCAMLGGGIYRDTIIGVGGYTTGGITTANCYKGVINPSTLNITWSQIPNYPLGPTLRMASHVAVKDQGVGIMCTGGAIGGSVPTSATFLWNFCTQSWLSGLPNNSLARYNFKACGRGNNIVYVVSGYTGVGVVGNTEYMTFTEIDGPCQNMVGINGNNGVPSTFALKQNYPNPFNPETKIEFSLPSAEFVNIVITDIAGKQISIAVNSLYTAGNHSVNFNAANLSSGIYLYTITAGEFKDTKKMMLIK